ncbi:mediator complex, subunit Med4, partial [Terfezia claveryi]
MDKIMEKSFDALEAALTQLIESISSYNPSPIAASAVVLADNEISESLELLAEHQANHHKIQSLRATSEALDQRLTQLLSALAQTRKELLTVPSTKFPPAREIPYEELLTYARKISKYTVPPNARFPQPPLPQAALSGNAPAEQPTTNIGLTNEEAAALDPSSRVVFAPWPSEEIMRRGALAQITFAGE